MYWDVLGGTGRFSIAHTGILDILRTLEMNSKSITRGRGEEGMKGEGRGGDERVEGREGDERVEGRGGDERVEERG